MTVLAIGCIDRPMTVFERLQDARRLTADALVGFTQAADASDRVLFASSEDTASAGAREAEQSLSEVQAVVDKLEPLLEGLEYSKELLLLDEFRKRFADYRQMDKQILEREQADGLRRTSNVHALALSLGQKRALVAACEDSLRALQASLAQRGFKATR